MAGDDHGRQRPQDQRVFEGIDDRVVLGQLDEPAEAEAFHGKDAELLGVEGQDDHHHDRREHEHVHQDRVEADQRPSR